MALIVPQFTYDPGTGTVNFVPTYPAIDKPGPQDGTADQKTAQRVDSITMSGKKQAFIIRTDIFRTLKFPYVPFTDLSGFSALMDWIISGGTVSYYPDSTLGTSTDYTLEDTDWKPSFAFREHASFTIELRKVV